MMEGGTTNGISNEVDKYFDPFENPRNKNFNLLDWWKGNQSIYPILSKVAKDIFAIPSSTVASENAFSLGKKIVDPFRSSQTPKMIEALVCTHDWLRADKFNLYKEPTDEKIAFYKELEEIQAMAAKAQGGNAQLSNSTSILLPSTP
ncbi:lectin protein kinase family protein [Prunus dulcis]|uniref:Lectin protein kinase family protein n=1 Tax=Prunus dulcis TaxID=3755 RepID=A0A4Y1RWK1_PRUDU|nr:lectin protein kinase family protein [Prunus dulcis]